MPSGIVKAVVLVEDLDAALHLVHDIAGLRPVSRFESTAEQATAGLGWPEGRGATRGAMVGERQGMLELVEIPAALRGELVPGVAGLSIGCRDARDRAGAAAANGYSVAGPHEVVSSIDGSVATIARIPIGGVPIEFIGFGAPPT